MCASQRLHPSVGGKKKMGCEVFRRMLVPLLRAGGGALNKCGSLYWAELYAQIKRTDTLTYARADAYRPG